jgi:hypothetical protein
MRRLAVLAIACGVFGMGCSDATGPSTAHNTADKTKMERIKERAKAAEEKVKAGAEAAGEKMKEGAEKVKQGAEKAGEKIKEEAKEIRAKTSPPKDQ